MLDEATDMASRLVHISGLELLSQLPGFSEGMMQVLALIQTGFRNKYRICSFLATQLNDLIETTVNFASRQENQVAYNLVQTAVQSYMEHFFGEVPIVIQMDFGKIKGEESADIKGELQCSFKMFDEGYHYMKQIKEIILYKLVPAMIQEFQQVS